MDIDKELNVGDFAEYSKIITESDINQFADITGDHNPVHVDELYAKSTQFKARIAHGILIASLISTVIANKLPGPGTIYLRQNLKFVAPVYIGDTITARVQVLSFDEGQHKVCLQTTCHNQNSVKVIDGEAIVRPPINNI